MPLIAIILEIAFLIGGIAAITIVGPIYEVVFVVAATLVVAYTLMHSLLRNRGMDEEYTTGSSRVLSLIARGGADVMVVISLCIAVVYGILYFR